MKKLIFIVAFIWLAVACQESDIMDFTSDDSAVYFQGTGGYSYPADGSLIYVTSYRYIDSMVTSFVGQKSTVKAVNISIPILTMGKVKDYKRPVKVVIDEARTTGVRGVNYEVNLDTVSIPAKAGKVSLRVTLYRTDDLLTGSQRVAFKLEGNEYFKLHIQSYKNSSNWLATADTMSAIKFAVIYNEQYTEPTRYSFFGEDVFGTWTPKKYQVINDVMEWTHADWSASSDKVSYGRFDFAGKAVQKYLQEMADAGTPVKDSDGTYMQLTPKYAVDYSKYED